MSTASVSDLSEQLIDFDRRMGLHSQFPSCCVEEWCDNIRKVACDFGDPCLFEISRAKKEAMGPNGEDVRFVPCWECVVKIRRGEMAPPKTHRCTRRNPECIDLWREMERLVGFKHTILR